MSEQKISDDDLRLITFAAIEGPAMVPNRDMAVEMAKELLEYRRAAKNVMFWEIAGNIFTTREDALKPGFRGEPEPCYEGPSIPSAGWKLAPEKPTQEMLRSVVIRMASLHLGTDEYDRGGRNEGIAKWIYSTMLKYSPEA